MVSMLIAKWKKQAKEGVVTFFSGKQQKAVQCTEDQIKDLHTKIGQLTVKKDFFCNKPSPKFEHNAKGWCRR